MVKRKASSLLIGIADINVLSESGVLTDCNSVHSVYPSHKWIQTEKRAGTLVSFTTKAFSLSLSQLVISV